MIRVWTLYFLRKFFEPVVLKSLVWAVLLVALISTVSVPHVIQNFVTSIKSSGNGFFFLTSAFSSTLLLVKLIVISGFVAGLVLVRDIVRLRAHTKFSPSLAN